MTTQTHSPSPTAQADGALRGSYGRRVATSLVLGLVGLLALGAYTALYARPAGFTPLVTFVAVVVNNGLLLLVAVLVGSYAAPRVGLRSHLLARTAGDRDPDTSFRAELPLAAGLGVASAVVVLVLDVAFAPFVAEALARLPAQDATLDAVLAFAPVRFLYGGITEELLLRFGLMTAVAFVGYRLLNRGEETPSSAVLWVAVVVAAILFGVGHLPAASASFGGLTPVLAGRTVLLNVVPGLVFGWLYWRRSLEAAMVAHGAFHVPILALSLAAVALA